MSQYLSTLGYPLTVNDSTYFLGEDHECKIMRGTWFYDGSWQPLEIGYASQIEAEHLGTFLGHRLDDDLPPVGKGPKPGECMMEQLKL